MTRQSSWNLWAAIRAEPPPPPPTPPPPRKYPERGTWTTGIRGWGTLRSRLAPGWELVEEHEIDHDGTERIAVKIAHAATGARGTAVLGRAPEAEKWKPLFAYRWRPCPDPDCPRRGTVHVEAIGAREFTALAQGADW